MPVDARIPLGAIAGDFRRARDVYADMDAAAEREEQRRERERRRRREDKADADRQAVRDVFALTPRKADGSVDLNRVANEAMLIDPEVGLTLQDKARQRDTQDLQFTNAQIEHGMKVAEFIGQKFGAIAKGDQAAWSRAVNELRQLDSVKGLGLHADDLPDQYDENVHAMLVEAGKTTAQRIQEAMNKGKAERAKQFQRTSIAWKGKEIEVPFDPDTGEYHLPDGTVTKHVAKYQKPDAPREGSDYHWRDVEEIDPETGETIVRTMRVRSGDVVKRKSNDDPKIPRGVQRYIEDMKRRGYTRADAEAEFASTRQEDAHPNLSPLAVQAAFDKLFGEEEDDVFSEPVPPRAGAPLGPGRAEAGPPAPQGGRPAVPRPQPSTPRPMPPAPGASAAQGTPKPMPSHAGGAFKVNAGGKVYSFPSAQAAAEFKRRAGIQ